MKIWPADIWNFFMIFEFLGLMANLFPKMRSLNCLVLGLLCRRKIHFDIEMIVRKKLSGKILKKCLKNEKKFIGCYSMSNLPTFPKVLPATMIINIDNIHWVALVLTDKNCISFSHIKGLVLKTSYILETILDSLVEKLSLVFYHFLDTKL